MSKTAEVKEDVKRRDLLAVRPGNLIVEEGFNVRIDEMEGIPELAQSIKESGLKTPLRVYKSEEDPTKYVVVNGHRRRLAILLAIETLGASIEYVDVVLEPRKYSEEQRTLDLILTNDGKRLRPIEEAMVFERLKNYGWTPKQIAEKSGRSLPQVYNLLDLMLAPQKIKTQIVENKISEGTVIAIMRSNKEADKQIALVEEAIKNAKASTVVETAVDGAVAPKTKKATLKHITSDVKVKSVMQILNEVAEKLIEEGNKTRSADVFLDVLAGAKKKKGVGALVKLFVAANK